MDIETAMRRAFLLGQKYWQQADSESFSENKRSDETLKQFRQLSVDIVSEQARLKDVADAVCKQFSLAGISAVIGSPNPAEDLHARAILALGGSVKREHIDSSACWCSPERDYTNPETGTTVWVHRQTQ